MKKYLMTGVAALAFAATFTSCSKTDLYDENKVEQDKTQAINDAYEKAFEAAFGKVGANVDWGFSSRTKTRGVIEGDNYIVKKDQWTNHPERLEGNTVPNDVTPEEAQYVYEWFQQNEGLTEFGKPWTSFFIQQVKGTMKDDKLGIEIKNGVEQTFTAKGGMDYLTVGDGTNMVHSRDFNAEEGGPWGIIFIKNASAMKFGYHGSYDNSERQLFKMAQITVPGDCFPDKKARTGWYVGLSLLAEKPQEGKTLGYQRRNFGDDWIVKVVPGNGESPYRIIAEDLTAAQSGDFDFNDVVFDYVSDDGVNTTFKLVACGGTLPLRINGDDNLEVHKLFGQDAPNANGKYDMFNTNTVAGKTHAPVEFTVTGVYKTPEKLATLKIEVEKEGSWQELKATKGKAACKILVDDTFPIIDERHSIASEQEDFTNYVSGAFDGNFWWKRL